MDHLAGRRGFAFVDEIAAAKFFGRQIKRVRDFIHLTLEGEYALRRSKSSERTLRREISRHSATVNPYVRTKVWTSSVDRSA